jgi:hypothetical protein
MTLRQEKARPPNKRAEDGLFLAAGYRKGLGLNVKSYLKLYSETRCYR